MSFSRPLYVLANSMRDCPQKDREKTRRKNEHHSENPQCSASVAGMRYGNTEARDNLQIERGLRATLILGVLRVVSVFCRVFSRSFHDLFVAKRAYYWSVHTKARLKDRKNSQSAKSF